MRSSVRRWRPGAAFAAVCLVGALVALPSPSGTAAVARDFSVRMTPAQLTMNAGQTASVRVQVVRTGRFPSSVNLRATGMPAGVRGAFRRVAADRFDLVLTAAPNAPTGSSCVRVTGRAAGRTREACTTVRVQGSPPPTVTLPSTTTTTVPPATTTTRPAPAPDFVLAASSAPAQVLPGNSVSWPVAVLPFNGFDGFVALSVAAGLPAGATATFVPATTPGASTLTIATAATTPPGTYPVTLRGSGGPGTRDANVVLVVLPVFDFATAVSPAGLTVAPGGSGTFAVTSTRATGASDVLVTYSIAGLPAGATAGFSANPAAGTTVMTVAAAATTAPGTYTLTLTAQSGPFVRSVPLTLTVGGASGYGITLAPEAATVARGSTTAFQVNVIAQVAFSGPVTLSLSGLPAGVSGAFAVNPVSPVGGQTLASTLTLTASGSAAPGTSTITVTGTAAGGLSASVSVPLTVA